MKFQRVYRCEHDKVQRGLYRALKGDLKHIRSLRRALIYNQIQFIEWKKDFCRFVVFDYRKGGSVLREIRLKNENAIRVMQNVEFQPFRWFPRDWKKGDEQ